MSILKDFLAATEGELYMGTKSWSVLDWTVLDCTGLHWTKKHQYCSIEYDMYCTVLYCPSGA